MIRRRIRANLDMTKSRTRRLFSLSGFAPVALLLSLACTPAHASFAVPPNKPGQYAPRDECSARPAGSQFLAKLKDAVTARDAVSVALLSAPDIKLDLGGGEGRDELVRRLLPESDLWSELDKILELGCAWDEDNEALVLPWFFNQDLSDSDPYSTTVALGSAVPLHKSSTPGAPAHALLDWQLVVVCETDEIGSPLIPVAVIDSELEGYIELEKLRSQLDYRVRAENRDGRWKITAFIAGD